jgi:PKD repeat protein
MCFFLVTTDVTPPTVPTNLRVTTNGCGTALVTWNASVESGNPSNAPVSGLKGYRIYRNGAFVRSVPSTTLATVEEGMSSATAYAIGVSAVDLADNESAPTVASVTIMSCPNQRPLANAGSSQTNLLGATTFFDGSASRDVDGRIVFYAWSFGDGALSSEVSPSHLYATAGLYQATLVVTDNLGLTGTNKAFITINAPPVAHAGPDQTNVVGATVSFDAGGSRDSDGTISTCTWQFGDGSGATGPGAVTSHVYTAVGTYAVRLLVRDNAGAIARANSLVTINANLPPVAVPGPNRSGVAKSNISFDGSASWDPDGIIRFYCWRFPDGTCISNAIAAYAFTNAGSYSVQLTVTDNAGASDTKSTTVSVTAPPEPLTPGQFLAVTNLGGPSGDIGNAMATDRNGNTFVGGRMSELPFLAKLSPSNTVLWGLQFGGAGVGAIQGVASASDGGVFVTGNL